MQVSCSSGTYVRALARDLGAILGVGGHLTSLRRTRSGPFTEMRALDYIVQAPQLLAMEDVVVQAFPVVRIAEDQAERARHGIGLHRARPADDIGTGPHVRGEHLRPRDQAERCRRQHGDDPADGDGGAV